MRGVLVCSRFAARRGAVLLTLRGGTNEPPRGTERLLDVGFKKYLDFPSAVSGTIQITYDLPVYQISS